MTLTRTPSAPTRILHIDASARTIGSATRALSANVVSRISDGPATVTRRDLGTPLPFIDETWVGATFTPPADRTTAQHEKLALSDSLVDELERADTIVIGTPIYNFGVPAALKAWVDQVARVGRTFNYTAEGPKGLLTGKRAVIAVASGGTEIGSDLDFATGYLRHVLGFLGIDDVTVVTGDTVDAELPVKHAA